MKKQLLLLSIFLLSVTFSMAQEKTFIVNRDFETTINTFSKLQSALMDDGADAAKSDKVFKTDITIKKEKYDKGAAGNNYLLLKYKKQKTNVTVSSVWNIVIEKLTANKTKVSVLLARLKSEDTANSQIDIAKTVSSGKLEKQVKSLFK